MAIWSKVNYAAVVFVLIGFVSAMENNETRNITATFGKIKTRNVSIVLLKDTFEGANHYCQSKGLGALFDDKTPSGLESTALRHWILSTYDESLFNETFWTGLIKRTIQWYKVPRCQKFTSKDLIINQTDNEQQCTALNMTKDETSNKYLLYATTCQQPRFFVCSMDTEGVVVTDRTDVLRQSLQCLSPTLKRMPSPAADPLEYEEFYQTVIDTIPDHSWWRTEQDFDNQTCFHQYFKSWYLVWAIQEWHENNTCVFYMRRKMDYTVQVQISKTTLNTTLKVKTARTNYQVIKPSSTIRPINSVTCSDPVVPSTEYVSSSLVCQSYETQFCSCGSPVTSEELDVKVEKLKTENKVSKSSLSSYTRTKTSAPDKRPSCTTMGVLGIVVITGVCVFIVSSDVPRLIKALNRLHRKTRKRI